MPERMLTSEEEIRDAERQVLVAARALGMWNEDDDPQQVVWGHLWNELQEATALLELAHIPDPYQVLLQVENDIEAHGAVQEDTLSLMRITNEWYRTSDLSDVGIELE